MKYQLIYSMLKLNPSVSAEWDARSASHAAPAEGVAALNGNNMQKEYYIKSVGRLGSNLAMAGACGRHVPLKLSNMQAC